MTQEDDTLSAADAAETWLVLLDCNLAAWSLHGRDTLPNAVDGLLVLLRAFCLLHRGNRLIWLGYREAGRAEYFLLPSGEATEEQTGAVETLEALDDEIGLVRSVVEFASADSATNTTAPGDADAAVVVCPSTLALALSLGLCALHARGWLTRSSAWDGRDWAPSTGDASAPLVSTSAATPRVRCLVVSSPAPDDPAQLVSVMNAAIRAQHAQMVIDVLRWVVRPSDAPAAAASTCSAFLQQCAFLTNGVYIECDGRFADAMSELLAQVLPSTATRALLLPPPTSTPSGRRPAPAEHGPRARVVHDVDLRATCFATGDKVELGYVCSCCLSVFASPRAVCATCQAPFADRSDVDAAPASTAP
eukprot:ctg_281.g168